MAYSTKQRKEIVDKICEKISNGSTLRKALDESTLAYDTFFRWIDEDEEKSKQYTRATELRAEAMAEELLSISDAYENDAMEVDGITITNHHIIQRDRLRVDSRKWLMSKMFPKKYSEKTTTDVNIKQEQPLFPDAE